MLASAAVSVIMAVCCALAAEERPELQVSDLKQLATGFQFTEGPVWHPGGYLIFSDIRGDTIYSLKDGKAEVFRRPSGNSNGLTLDTGGRVVACEHGNRRVSLTLKTGEVVALATHYKGKRLNSPNDVVVKSDGSIYFTDPPYGVRKEDRQLDFQGVYRIGPDGALTLLADDFSAPNGLAFSPDEKVLYVDDSERHWVRAFGVREDGSLANGHVFARLEGPDEGVPDGMKVDEKGNVYVAGPGGVWVFDSGGKHLGTIRTPEVAANVAFGGDDDQTLYVTARHSVYSVRVKYAGAAVPARRAASMRE